MKKFNNISIFYERRKYLRNNATKQEVELWQNF